MRLTIKAKILLASFTIVSLVVWMMTFVLGAHQSLAGLMSDVLQKDMEAMRMAEQIKYNFVLYDDLVFRHLFTQDPILLTEAARVREKVRAAVAAMKATAEGRTEKELLAEIEDETARYDRDVKRLFDTSTFRTEGQKQDVRDLLRAIEAGRAPTVSSAQRNQRQALALLSAEGRARLVRIYSQCEKLVDISRSKLEQAQRRAQDTVVRTRRAAFWAGLFVVFAAGGVAAFLAVGLLAPLQTLLKGVRKVTEGELDLEIPVESSDEVGRLTQAFNAMTRNLRSKQEKLTTETITDSLTELYNFRYFQARLKDEVSRADRHRHPFALLILDVDHFKRYNDAHGHQTGNAALKEAASVLKGALRQEDFIARYGGEEFVVILPETDKASARMVAERLRRSVGEADFPGQKARSDGHLTISIGGALFPHDASSSTRLVEAADRALYTAKRTGRDRVVWADGLGEKRIGVKGRVAIEVEKLSF